MSGHRGYRVLMDASSSPAKTQSAHLARSVLALGAVLALAGGVGIGAVAIIRNPTLEGIAGGVFGGFMVALVVMGLAAWAAMAMMRTPKPVDTVTGNALAAQLQDVLGEVEAARLETVAAINKRAVWRVPVGAAAGVALTVATQVSGDPPDFLETILMLIAPAFGGYLWASMGPASAYARLYKDKVLPRLAASFGSLSYRGAHMPDLERLREECIFRKFDAVEADDEIFGTHRTRPISIVELKLTHGSGNNKRTTFDGLLTTMELPRDTGAVTAVVTDAGGLGNFLDRQKGQHRERVRLEDVAFEKIYEVYGTDQVASRALLHPAFMEKLLALGALQDFERPQVLCAGRVLQIAMPKRTGANLFEPPSFTKPAATREQLVQLQKDIAGVLAAVDAVIDLDHRFEVRSG